MRKTSRKIMDDDDQSESDVPEPGNEEKEDGDYQGDIVSEQTFGGQ